MPPKTGDRQPHRARGYSVLLDPDRAGAYLDALYERRSPLAARVDDWLDRLEEDPFDEAVVRRSQILADANGRRFSATSVRARDEEAMVGWRVEGQDVHIIVIADNSII